MSCHERSVEVNQLTTLSTEVLKHDVILAGPSKFTLFLVEESLLHSSLLRVVSYVTLYSHAVNTNFLIKMKYLFVTTPIDK